MSQTSKTAYGRSQSGHKSGQRATDFTVLACGLVVTAVVAALGAVKPLPALAAIVAISICIVVARLGRDSLLIWLMIVPWQFIPGINANVTFNTWLWLGLYRLLTNSSSLRGRATAIRIAVASIVPVGYVCSGIFFGISEPSLLTWIIPYFPVALSLVIAPPNIEDVRKHLFAVGLVTSVFVFIEYATGWSTNSFIDSNLSVQEYLRSDRALGTLGNPLFTSSILLVALFCVPSGRLGPRLAQLLIVISIVLTGSKSALIGVAAGFLVMAVSKGPKRFLGIAAALASGVVLVQIAADRTSNTVLQRLAMFSDLRAADPDRAFTTDFVMSWLQMHPLGGTPVGSALVEKRLLSPIAGGSRFGIESTWLAMAADVGVLVVGLFLVLSIVFVVQNSRTSAIAPAYLALIVSLFFWNGFFGSWIISPLFLVLLFAQSESPLPRVSAVRVRG